MNKKHGDLKDLRQFGIALGAILAVVSLVYFLKGRGGLYPWFFGAGVVTILLAVFLPKSLRPVYVIFTKAAHAIGWFNTRVILILIYFIFVTPIAFVMRIFNKDPLNRKIDKDSSSYWVRRPVARPDREGLEKQF